MARSARLLGSALSVAVVALLVPAVPAYAADTAPGAPQTVAVAASDGSLEVSWAAPLTDGGQPIDRYTASAYSALAGGAAVASCFTAGAGVATSCFITGLTNGTTYYVDVTARNSVGTGPASAPRVSGKPGAKPAVPRFVLTNRVSGGVRVSWLAPLTDGGSPVTGYTATAFASTSPTADPVATCTTSTLTCSITGLTIDTTYYVSVHASNALGSGPESDRVTVRPGSAPEAPRFVKVERGNGLALVSWSPPLVNGGSAITRYVVRAYRTLEGGEPMATCEPLTLAKLVCPVGPLPNGSMYYIEVVAITALAESSPSVPRLGVIPATTPDPPRSVSASRIGPEVHVQWAVPVADGGLPIDAYIATAYTLASGGTSVGSCTTNGDQCDIHGLTGRPVYVDVVARTGAGDSLPSAPRVKVRLVDKADEPKAVAGSARHRAIAVTWQPPLSDGGPQIASYRASAFTTPTGGTEVSSCTLPVTAANAAQASSGSTARVGCSIHGLAQAALYYLEVGATTEVGTTVPTTRTAVRVRPGSPLPPRGVKGFPSDRRIKVTWQLPASDGGLPITAYRVQAWSKQTGGEVASTCSVPVITVTSDYTCTLAVAYDFEPYWVEVAAQTTRGWGQSSKRIHLEANPAVPAAPENVVLAPRDLGLAVRWTAPSFDGGYPVYAYVARAFDAPTGGAAVAQCSSRVATSPTSTATAPTTCTMSGLKDDQYVYVEVTAENTVGISAPSGRENALIVPGRPVAPAGVAARAVRTGIQVSWSPPAASPTMLITGYRVRAYLPDGTRPVGECTVTTTSCTITSPEAAKAVTVTVAAQNSAGWSDPSAPVKVVTPQ